jgi:hypothetical protein
LSENASKTGKPEISFTENKDPDNESVIEKSSPWEPKIDITVEPEPYTVNLAFIDEEMPIPTLLPVIVISGVADGLENK